MHRLTILLGLLALAACSPPPPLEPGVAGRYEPLGSPGGIPGLSQQPEGEGAQAPEASQPADADLDLVAEDTSGISDEQDFEAVSTRQTIQSDANRLRIRRSSREVISPKALPSRRAQPGISVVEHAISTNNDVGEAVYRRTKFIAAKRYLRICGRYASPDLAQEAFLKQGGPQFDRRGVDPDGDGFACDWNPAPLRQAFSKSR